MSTTDTEIFEALRSERRWALVERIAIGASAVFSAIILFGLVSAMTLVAVDAWNAPASMDDGQ